MIKRNEIRTSDGILLAYKIDKNFQQGLTPYSNEKDFLQVLSWNYSAGTHLPPHSHLSSPRKIAHTQELIIILSGRLRAQIFDKKRLPVNNIILEAGETMVFLRGGHGYEILEDDTRVLEIKNGPYPGADKDRERY